MVKYKVNGYPTLVKVLDTDANENIRHKTNKIFLKPIKSLSLKFGKRNVTT